VYSVSSSASWLLTKAYCFWSIRKIYSPTTQAVDFVSSFLSSLSSSIYSFYSCSPSSWPCPLSLNSLSDSP
jgi:hypothetical protein